MKTRKEVEELKNQWLYDPIWDLWETEGFEEYKEELEKFASKELVKIDFLENFFKEWGIKDNWPHDKFGPRITNFEKFVNNITKLISRVDALEKEIEGLKMTVSYTRNE